MDVKDKEALLFVDLIPVEPEVITRTQLLKILKISTSQLSSLIYRLSFYIPIAEDGDRLCWMDQKTYDETRAKIVNGEIHWLLNDEGRPSVLQRRLME